MSHSHHISELLIVELILPKPREVIEKTVAHPTSSFLTAEEERELEELLDSD